MEVFFPKSTGIEMALCLAGRGDCCRCCGRRARPFSLLTAEVIHQSGAPSTALRLSDGERVFAYSGDTAWTDALLRIAPEADLFMCECYGFAGTLTNHLSWEVLQPKLAALRAKRVMLTHMNPSMLARLDEIKAAGVLVAADGLQLEF